MNISQRSYQPQYIEYDHSTLQTFVPHDPIGHGSYTTEYSDSAAFHIQPTGRVWPTEYRNYTPPVYEPAPENRPERRRVAVACGRCRQRKIKCSGDPGYGMGCEACQKMSGSECTFLRVGAMGIHEVDASASRLQSPHGHTWVTPHPPTTTPHGLPQSLDDVYTHDHYTTTQFPLLPALGYSLPNTAAGTLPIPQSSDSHIWSHSRHSGYRTPRPNLTQDPPGWGIKLPPIAHEDHPFQPLREVTAFSSGSFRTADSLDLRVLH